MRNLFESNEPEPEQEDIKAISNGPHVMLPPLAEGYEYELAKLPSGRSAVIVTGEAEVLEPETKSCGGTGAHEKYKACEDCQKYQGSENLDSPESRTLRHRD
jgi:hypothetical protein